MFREAMRRLDLWWEPMATEIAMLKTRNIYKVVLRPLGRNIVESKWIFALK